MKQKFANKILILGYGSVSQCTLPILLDKLDVPLGNITIIDFVDKAAALKKFTGQGINFVRERITRDNLGSVLSQYVSRGGLLIDLAWNIGCNDIVRWCHEHDVLYVNTSVEVWDSAGEMTTKSPFEKSLYWRQLQLR